MTNHIHLLATPLTHGSPFFGKLGTYLAEVYVVRFRRTAGRADMLFMPTRLRGLKNNEAKSYSKQGYWLK